jgi:hypothetical protein
MIAVLLLFASISANIFAQNVPDTVLGNSRGYLTTPQELSAIKQKANRGIQPYRGAIADVLLWANKDWNFILDANISCANARDPLWNDESNGAGIVYSKALAYHLTGNPRYAAEVKNILERVMTKVLNISTVNQCGLNFGWGTPEYVAAADLIEDYWQNLTCTGPTSTVHGQNTISSGNCKVLFQNWLVKNPYYVTSYLGEGSTGNGGGAATNAMAYVADYLWDRPSVKLVNRSPRQINGGNDTSFSPAEAYARAKQLVLDKMNGYRQEYVSGSSCDYLSGAPQGGDLPYPVKSQISEGGILTQDAQRAQSCNISHYASFYQNYPQVHLGNTIQQCELMLRRGDRSCFDNVDNTDLSAYSFKDPKGVTKTTHLRPGRGSVEKAINAVITATAWKHNPALVVAYRYYFNFKGLPSTDLTKWAKHLAKGNKPAQDVCFGTLTHGFAPGENLSLPPTVPAPGGISLADTSAPIISAVTSSGVTTNTATIAWMTDEDSDSQVEYGLTTSYGLVSNLVSTQTKVHSINLANLQSGKTYSYHVKSRDAVGNLATSNSYSFITAASSADSTSPTNSALAGSNVTANSATITWNINEDSDFLVQFHETFCLRCS